MGRQHLTSIQKAPRQFKLRGPRVSRVELIQAYFEFKCQQKKSTMPETRVPMTLRDHFLEDPFFSSSWSHMEKVRENFFNQSMSKMFDSSESRNSKSEDKSSSLVKADESSLFRPWMMPRNWMMPKLFDENFNSLLDMKDSSLISMKNDEKKMEISLNTTGYKPSELKVNVADGELTIEGKHEEKSEAGHTMVSKQFSRRYTLPAEAKLAEVESNLSQDGVMVITVPKEKKIQEIKENETKQVEKKSSFSNEQNSKKVDQQVNVEKKVSTSSLKNERKNQTHSLVPLTMRDSFFDDPFFKDTWMDIEKSHKNFFEESRKLFEQSLSSMESKMKSSEDIFKDTDAMSIFGAKDSNVIRIVDDDLKMEISIDTAGYKPDELKVSAGKGVISVDGRHEEKSEEGHVMVSRQFSKTYSLPQDANAEDVVSNLSQDGILVISVPKREQIMDSRSVPIAIK